MAKNRKNILKVRKIAGMAIYDFCVTVSAALLFLSYASAFVDPSRAWMITIFGLLYLPIFLVNLFFLCRSFRKKRKIFWLSFVFVLPSLFLIGRYFQIGFSNENEIAQDNVIKVLSYNVGRYSFNNGTFNRSSSSRRKCKKATLSYVFDSDADVICLQEVHVPLGRNLDSELKREFKGYDIAYYLRSDASGYCGNVILSHFPILSKGQFAFKNSSNLAVYADLDLGDKVVRMYNCHFESYNISLPGIVKSIREKVRRRFKNVRSQKDKNDIRKVVKNKLRRSIKRRPGQVDIILKDIEHCSKDAIVTGDFNDTPLSYAYNRLSRGRKDAFVEAGAGFGYTYSLLRPLLRIDYILFPKDMKAYSYKSPNINMSDHYPIIVDLQY